MVRRAALEAVSQSLEGNARADAPVRTDRGLRDRPSLVSRATSARPVEVVRPQPGPIGSLAKRAPEELEQVSATLLEYISAHPGEGIEAISEGLDIPSKELVLPVKKLLAAGRLKKDGEKRSTRYFAN